MLGAIRRNFFRFSRDRSGASAVEFALVLPAFVTLIFGIIEFSRLIFVGSSVQWATDRAARLAVIDPEISVAEIETELKSYLDMAGSPPVDVSLTTSTVGGVEVIHVNAHYDHAVEGPFIPSFTIGFDFETNIPKP